MGHDPFQLLTSRGNFRVAVDGDVTAPALILSNSLGTTLEMWTPQVAEFAKHWRVIRYDTRGHGGSPVTPGPYRFDDLGQDVLALLDALSVEQAAFCGISMGGHTGLWLGIHAATRLSALVVCNSAARIGTQPAWLERASMVRAGGATSMRNLADSAPVAGSPKASFMTSRTWCNACRRGWHRSTLKAMQPAARPWRLRTCAPTWALSVRPHCCWQGRSIRSLRWPMPRPCRSTSHTRNWRCCQPLTCRIWKH